LRSTIGVSATAAAAVAASPAPNHYRRQRLRRPERPNAVRVPAARLESSASVIGASLGSASDSASA
jgi:hypothetical protein